MDFKETLKTDEVKKLLAFNHPHKFVIAQIFYYVLKHSKIMISKRH